MDWLEICVVDANISYPHHKHLAHGDLLIAEPGLIQSWTCRRYCGLANAPFYWTPAVGGWGRRWSKRGTLGLISREFTSLTPIINLFLASDECDLLVVCQDSGMPYFPGLVFPPPFLRFRSSLSIHRSNFAPPPIFSTAPAIDCRIEVATLYPTNKLWMSR